MIANYHTHTMRCGHARGEDREYVEQAIASGLKILGFADHAYYPVLQETWNLAGMNLEKFEEYAESILSLKKEYANDIEIYLGVEAEYYPAYFEGLLRILDLYHVEYMILGQHYLNNWVGEPMVKRVRNDIHTLEQYCSQVIEAMETGFFSYLAHPDLIHDMEDPIVYGEQMRKVCKTANRCRIPVELNLAGITSGVHYPNEKFWKIAGEEGCQVILGADAHNPLSVRPQAALPRAMELVERYQLHLIDTLELPAPSHTFFQPKGI